MNRRTFVALASAVVFAARPAAGQGLAPLVSIDELIRIINDPAAISKLLGEMDTLRLLILVGTGDVSRQPTNDQYRQFRNVLTNPDMIGSARALLQSPDARERLSTLALPRAQSGIPKLQGLLAQIGIQESSRLMSIFLRAFYSFTVLVTAAVPHEQPWYCRCYGLEFLCRS